MAWGGNDRQRESVVLRRREEEEGSDVGVWGRERGLFLRLRSHGAIPGGHSRRQLGGHRGAIRDSPGWRQPSLSWGREEGGGAEDR